MRKVQAPNIKSVTILGATGSIGSSTLDVISRHPDRYRVFALTAANSVDKMATLIREFSPTYAVMSSDSAAEKLTALLASTDYRGNTVVLSGEDSLCQVARAEPVDMVMAAIVGAAGLLPTLAAAQAGKRVLLANKESLVMAGPLFMAAIEQGGAELLPIDSEHNAIFQAIPDSYAGNLLHHGISKILLTASGGPFRGASRHELLAVTPAQAVAHPNWSMGQKISVDSATLMNKGLELIEACFLFNCKPEHIQVVVHPESVIHSMVQYVDGSVLAQLGQPDMRTPIAYGMAWPERVDAGVASLDVFDIAGLHFEAPDEQVFPALALAKRAFYIGGTMPAVLNAANEIAVEAFLTERIPFVAIPTLVSLVMDEHTPVNLHCLDDVLTADAWARDVAIKKLSQCITELMP